MFGTVRTFCQNATIDVVSGVDCAAAFTATAVTTTTASTTLFMIVLTPAPTSWRSSGNLWRRDPLLRCLFEGVRQLDQSGLAAGQPGEGDPHRTRFCVEPGRERRRGRVRHERERHRDAGIPWLGTDRGAVGAGKEERVEPIGLNRCVDARRRSQPDI